jgi:hypothetical protein
MSANAASTSPASAIATARFSSTTGEPGEPSELPVQPSDLGPVLGLLRVQGRDRGLKRVRTAPAQGRRAIERSPSFRDLVAVPQ